MTKTLPIQIADADRNVSSPALKRYVAAAIVASLIGGGLVRFCYTSLLPRLIEEKWFAPSEAIYLGAASLAGYMIGALIGRPLGRRIENAWVLRLANVAASLSFFGCCFPLSFGWFFFWRLLAGIGGGTAVVLVAATVLPHVPQNRKGLVSGAIFLGLGLGILASGTLVPLLLHFGIRTAWVGLGVFSTVLTIATWGWWPEAETLPPAAHPSAVPGCAEATFAGKLTVYAEFAFVAFGPVAPMLFLVDYVERQRHSGFAAGSACWVFYGLGAVFGPVLYGHSADRFGAHRAMRIIFAVQAVAIACLAWSGHVVVVAFLAIIRWMRQSRALACDCARS